MTTHCTTRAYSGQTTRNMGFFARLSLIHAAWRQRRALAALNDAALADIGVTRTQARAEARRPLWDVPQHWRK